MFRKYLAVPNIVPLTPAAPFRQNLFMENILAIAIITSQKASLRYAFCAYICRSRGLCGKVSRRGLNCCQNSGGEGEGVRYADKPGGLSAHARTAVFAIGRAKTVTERGIYPRETNRTQNLWRTLGFPFPHDFYQLPQQLAKKICFAKIFCEEEERAFSAYCPALPNSRVVRSVPTTSV